MYSFKVTAGDVRTGDWLFNPKYLKEVGLPFRQEKIPLDQIETIESVDELQQKKAAGTLGAGLAGGLLLGPLGAVGGMLVGGNKSTVRFVCYLKDGRKFLAETSAKDWGRIRAVTF